MHLDSKTQEVNKIKKQNQEIKFKSSETDPDKICIHVWIFYMAE